MPYGYIGQNQPNQALSNTGVLSVQDALNLKKQGYLGGSVELVEERSIISGSAIDFINLADNPYDVYYLTISKLQAVSQAQIIYRFSNDNGSTFRSGVSDYMLASYRVTDGNSANELKSNAHDSIQTDSYVNTAASTSIFSAYCYFYNLLDSTAYSQMNQHSATFLTNQTRSTYGGGFLKTAEVNNAIRITNTGVAEFTSGTAKLFGIKKI
jgi:hypothetical protein